MAIITVQQTDTFENWRQKSNNLSTNLGDLETLNTSDKLSVTGAINELNLTKTNSSSFSSVVGEKNNLITDDKSNLVAAINELKNSTGGDLEDLTTTTKDSLIDAINELDADIGSPSLLSTTIKTNLVSAVNEVVSNLNTANLKVKPISEGGTNATNATDARANLGLGSIATQNSNNVSITGGSITASVLSGSIDKNRINVTNSANQLIGTTSTNSGLEYKTIIAGTNIQLVHSANSLTINGEFNNTPIADKLSTPRQISSSGDVQWAVTFDGSSAVTSGATLSNTGVTAGTWQSVTVDAKGRVTAGTALIASMIPALDLSKITTGFGTGVATFLATPTSANLAAAITNETGSGALVFGTSPAITTSITTPSTTFALVNTTATTINFAGAATTLNLGAATGTTTVNNNLNVAGILSISNGAITSGTLTTSTTTANQVIASLAAATYRTIKVLAQVTSGTSYQSCELLLIHNGTTVQITEYANLFTSSTLATFDADINSGNIRLLTTPVNASTVYKVLIQGINL